MRKEVGGGVPGRGHRYRSMAVMPCARDNVSQKRIEQDMELDVEDDRCSPLPVWRACVDGLCEWIDPAQYKLD